jgi:dipeptidyl aminopeptidase/acylaminoacyl peptidase
MKKIIKVLLVLAVLSIAAIAQDKLLTLDEIFNPDAKVRVRFGGTPVHVQWAADGRSFRQVIGGKLMRVDAVTGQAVPYFESEGLAAALQRNGVIPEVAAAIANSDDLLFNKAESEIVINNGNDLWIYDTAPRTLRRLTNDRDEEKEVDFSPDGRWVSFVRENNLFVVDALKGSEKQLTRDSDELARQRQQLPWVPVEDTYTFQTSSGPKTLAELFDMRPQLLVYHLMFGPEDRTPCIGCSFTADSFDGDWIFAQSSCLGAADGTAAITAASAHRKTAGPMETIRRFPRPRSCPCSPQATRRSS